MIDESLELTRSPPVTVIHTEAIQDPGIPSFDFFFIPEGTNAPVISKVRTMFTDVIRTMGDFNNSIFIRGQRCNHFPVYVLESFAPIRRLCAKKSNAQDMVRSKLYIMYSSIHKNPLNHFTSNLIGAQEFFSMLSQGPRRISLFCLNCYSDQLLSPLILIAL